MAIVVTGLTKTFRVHEKEPGLLGSVRGLFRRKYRDVPAVAGVSFRIDRGELVGFLGPNGAGKTTTVKMLAGVLYPTSGSASVLGHVPWHRQAAFLRRISLVLGQKNQLWWDLPPIESFRLQQAIYEIEEPVFRKRLAELVDLLDLTPLLDVQVRKLSLGERMKCELAAALLHGPEVLFLDEPTLGLDVVMQKRMRAFIREYQRRHGATIILTSHYMDDVAELCSRVIVIDAGRVIYDGGLDELVRRHADYKTLTVSFASAVGRSALQDIGEVVSYDPHKATLRVSRDRVSSCAARLLDAFPVVDLAIQEADLADIVREVFANDGTGRPARDVVSSRDGQWRE